MSKRLIYIRHVENCHSCLQGPVYHSYLSLCYMCIYYTFGKLPFMFTRTGLPQLFITLLYVYICRKLPFTVISHFVICVYITHLENCHSCLQGPVDQFFITLLYVYILHIWKIAIHVYKDRLTSFLSLCYMCIYYTFGKLPFMFTRTGLPQLFITLLYVYILHIWKIAIHVYKDRLTSFLSLCYMCIYYTFGKLPFMFTRTGLPQLFITLLYVYILHIWKIAIHVYKDRFTTVIYHFVICVYITHVENCHSRFLRAG